MRPSSYLNTVEIGDGNSIVYNGFTMCIDVVPSEIARALVAAGQDGDLPFLLPDEKEHLASRGHLTTLTVKAEREAIGRFAADVAKTGIELARPPFGSGVTTFILTYQCNLACDYCYQKEVRKSSGRSTMSEEFVDEFFDIYRDKLLASKSSGNQGFTLYGGEPLLPGNRGAIQRILRYAKRDGIIVSTVTNAVALPEMLDLVGPEKGKINNVQVTLDGERMFHDGKRVSPSGGPTFEHTLFALRELIKTGANAIVRIHLHPKSLESGVRLVEYLEREKILGHDRVKAYLWSTDDLNSKALSPEEYDLFSELFLRVAFCQNSPPTAHFAFLRQILEMKALRNRLVRKHCDICVTGLHCVVDSLGDVYECIDDAGHKERRVATLANGEVESFGIREDCQKPYLSDRPACLECSVAFFCGGGCPNRLKTPAASFCLQIKEFIALTLKSYFLLKQNTGSPK